MKDAWLQAWELVALATPSGGSCGERMTFSELAEDNPAELLRLIEAGGLDNVDLSFAAEALGELVDSTAAIGALKKLVAHPSALVREGALYGLCNLESAEAFETAASLKDDVHPGVRRAVESVLKGWKP